MQKNLMRLMGMILLLALAGQGEAGVWSVNEFFYKPALGSRGEIEKNRFDQGLDQVDARLGKYKTLGDPKHTTLSQALTTFGSSEVTLALPAGTVAINANTTIPANITLHVMRGGVLTVANGVTLTINGPVEAGAYKIFSLVGTGKVSLANNKKISAVYPHWWGATADGSTDDTDAWTAAKDSGALIVDGLNQTYKITTTSGLVVAAGQTFRNFTFTHAPASHPAYMIKVNTGSKVLNGKLVGSNTSAVSDVGIMQAADGVNDVELDVEVSHINNGIHANTSSSFYPARWRVKAYIHDILFDAVNGGGDGFGGMLENSFIDLVAKNISAHAIYLYAGAQHNIINIHAEGCQAQAVVLKSYSWQRTTSYNQIRGSIRNFGVENSSPGVPGGVVILEGSHYNDVRMTIIGDSNMREAISVQGASGGPYPLGNIIDGCRVYGQSVAAYAVNLTNALETRLTNNILHCYGTDGVVMVTTAGTCSGNFKASIENNIIDAQNQDIGGINLGGVDTIPVFLGLNRIKVGSSGLRVKQYNTNDIRRGFTRRLTGRHVFTGVGGGSWANTTITLPDTGLHHYQYAIGDLPGYVQATIVGASAAANKKNLVVVNNVTKTTFDLYVYNDHTSSQNLTVHWTAEGD